MARARRNASIDGEQRMRTAISVASRSVNAFQGHATHAFLKPIEAALLAKELVLLPRPLEAAELLSRSRLDWQVHLATCLRDWLPGERKLTEGHLILAWANLGALIEVGLLRGLRQGCRGDQERREARRP